MKRILITQSNFTIGGIQKVLINFLNQLDYKKYEVDLVLFEKKGELLDLIPNEVNVIELKEKYKLTLSKWKRIAIETTLSEKYFKKLYKDLANEKQYDTAIAFDGYVAFTDYYAAFSNAKKKLIWVHSDFAERKKHQKAFAFKLPTMRRKYRFFDKVVAVSKSAMDGFIKVFPQYKSKTSYLWNPIDIPSKINLNNNSISLNKDTFNIVAIGSLQAVKGFDRLIAVHKQLQDKKYRVKIYVMGEGPERKKLEIKIKLAHLENDFILLGNIKNVYPILNQADLFVLSSYYEGFAIVLLESLACGIPILVPDISGATDVAKEIAPPESALIVTNSQTGLLNGIIETITKPKSKFQFDTEKYNKDIITKFEKEIG